MANETESQSASADSATQNGMPKLQKLLIVVTGLGFLINASVSLSHTYGPDADHNRVVHDAMEEFKKGMPESVAKKANGGFGSKSDVTDLFNEKKPAADTTTKDLRPSESQSQIAKLSCKKYGGPSDEDAKEMIYWSDIPSDSKYVSPFRLKRRRRQYMTFEPDGGMFFLVWQCATSWD